MSEENIQQNTENGSSAEEEVHLLDYFVVLAKHSRMIFFVTLAVSVITLSSLFVMPNMYTATARLLPPQQSSTLIAQMVNFLGMSATPGAGGGGLGGMAAGLLGLKSPADLYVGMLTGDTIFDRIIKRFKLRKRYEQKFIEDTRLTLAKRADIIADKDGMISINVTDEDPKEAAAMANAFAEEMDLLLQRIAQHEAKGYLVFLEKEKDITSQNLNKSEEALRVFSEKTNVLQIDAQTKGMLDYIASLRAAIDAKEVQVKVSRQQATPYNFDIIQLKTEIKGLKDKLHAAEASMDTTCKGDVCIPTSKVPALGLQYFRLLREAKYQEILYQMYCKLTEMARLDSVRSASMVNVVDYAIPPERKSKPKRLLITAGVGVFTFFVLVFVAFIQEYWRQVKGSQGSSQRLNSIQTYLAPFTGPITKFLSYFHHRHVPRN